MSRETSLLSPSLILRPRWARTPGCSGSDLEFIEPYPGLFSRSVLYAIVCNEVTDDLLLYMPCHLSKIHGLRWQGGSLERGCLAHREISWLSSLAQGHPLIAIFTHPLNVSITSMLKPMNMRKKKNSTPSQPPNRDFEERKARSSWGFMARKIYFSDP